MSSANSNVVTYGALGNDGKELAAWKLIASFPISLSAVSAMSPFFACFREFQSQLPENGALPLLNPSSLTNRQLLPDMFHDHVIEMTQKDWR